MTDIYFSYIKEDSKIKPYMNCLNEVDTKELMPLYRYDRDAYGYLACTKYYVIHKTARGYWIADNYGYVMNKWVSNCATKRFAYPTESEALNSFIARKKRQITILSNSMASAKRLLKEATLLKEREILHELD